MKIILTWLLAACALLLVAYLYPGVQVQSFTSALIAAAVIGLFNAVLRPMFVINALLFWAAASVLSGFQVNGFVAALVGSLIYSVLMLVVNTATRSILR